jgi:hypothetical protein
LLGIMNPNSYDRFMRGKLFSFPWDCPSAVVGTT